MVDIKPATGGLHRRALKVTRAVAPKVSVRLCPTDANVSSISVTGFILRCLESNSARRHQRRRVAARRRVPLKRRGLLFSSPALFHNGAAVGAAPVCSAERLRHSHRRLKSTPLIAAKPPTNAEVSEAARKHSASTPHLCHNEATPPIPTQTPRLPLPSHLSETPGAVT